MVGAAVASVASGTPGREPVLECARLRRGDEGLLSLGADSPTPRFGALLLSVSFRSVSRTETRVGDEGNDSSAGFRGTRTRLGDPDGLWGRNWGENDKWPAPLRPGMDCVRAMGGARLAAERDRTCEMESGEPARGRYGRAADGAHDGEVGEDVGEGSVDRRSVGGLRRKSNSGGVKVEDPWTLKLGRGAGRKASIRSVSGTGSMLVGGGVERSREPGLLAQMESHGMMVRMARKTSQVKLGGGRSAAATVGRLVEVNRDECG